jgi:hypothetical protein
VPALGRPHRPSVALGVFSSADTSRPPMRHPGPFLIFLGSGWLIITRPGSFDIGSLVASLAAYDRLNEPWQELLDYYSLKEIAVTRYAQIMASVASPNRQD